LDFEADPINEFKPLIIKTILSDFKINKMSFVKFAAATWTFQFFLFPLLFPTQQWWAAKAI
jgi:hypothetical protein